jgi:thiamine biosynthesis protein ThiC
MSIDEALRFGGIEDKVDAPQAADMREAIKLPPPFHG